ncbi:uncharacterized protein LOC141686363 [Apium graveolens]|uniref:uncharacterized protein LOC141686363 n=1 Tax=Apium graveolens TaxID=4045 RepID=UPI003D7A7653
MPNNKNTSSKIAEGSWTLFIDGSSTTILGRAGIILTSPEGFKIQQAVKFNFKVTNNEAEYEAIIVDLRLARSLEVKIIKIFSDFQLVVKQIMGKYKILNDRMTAYANITKGLLESITSWTLSYIDRSENQWADSLSKLTTPNPGSSMAPNYIMDLTTSSITDSPSDINCVNPSQDWRTPLIQFIQGTFPEMSKDEKRKISFKARNYCIENKQLYRRSLTEPLLKCVGNDEVEMAMIEFC